MSEERECAPGTFIWAELVARDTRGAADFYMPLFSWEKEEAPLPDGAGTYAIFSREGKHACGMYEMLPEVRGSGRPAHWQSYVKVDSADAAAQRAEELGARLAHPPCDVMEAGRMAMIQDPTGAFLCLWQPGAHKGAQIFNRPGALCWNELLTKDTARAASFYAALFGWTTSTAPTPTGAGYTMFHNAGRENGGMLEIGPEMGEAPPHWQPYFAVESCDAALERAKALGGQCAFPAMEVPGAGRFAGVMDPEGAAFVVIELQKSPD